MLLVTGHPHSPDAGVHFTFFGGLTLMSYLWLIRSTRQSQQMHRAEKWGFVVIVRQGKEPFMSERHQHFMREALKMARIGLDKGELPIGAVVVLNGEVIAAAHTMEKSEGRLLVHADLLALEAADRLKPFPGKRREAILYVTGEPCLMCLGAAMSFFLGEIYYGHESPGDGAVELVQQWQRKEADFPDYRVPRIVGGVLRQEAIDLFKEYVTRYSSGALWEWAKTIAAL